MIFSGTVFLYLFLPCVLLGYYVIFRKSRKWQNIFLLFASLFFYAWGEPTFVLVMLMSIFMNWAFGLLADKYKRENKKGAVKAVLAVTVIANLSILFVFKYLNFTCDVFSDIFGIDISIAKIALPIGISFFTFQAMSYVLDVYRGKGEVQKNILNVGLYISFFPQLIAGPIVRYETVADEIKNRKETADDFFDGFARFIVGLGKKVILANNFAVIADNAFDGGEISVAMSWLGAIAYTLQIYFDFGGYSDMAIGLGRMFGFHFLENFNYPYISKSITEFWRRWHISLGTWFRDYVYIPLGGSRVGKKRLILNLFIVWMLTGIWHGANWTFILWGFMYFILLTAEKLTGFYKQDVKCPGAVKWIYTMFFVVMGWVLFRADSLGSAWEYMKSMFGLAGNAFSDELFITSVKQISIYLPFGILFSFPVVPKLREKVKQNTFTDIAYCTAMIALFAFSLVGLIGNSYNPFIYFNF